MSRRESSDSLSSSLSASLAKRMSLNKTEERAMDALVGLASMSPARNAPSMKPRVSTPLPTGMEEQASQASNGSASNSTRERSGEAEKETLLLDWGLMGRDSGRKRNNEEKEYSSAGQTQMSRRGWKWLLGVVEEEKRQKTE